MSYLVVVLEYCWLLDSACAAGWCAVWHMCRSKYKGGGVDRGKQRAERQIYSGAVLQSSIYCEAIGIHLCRPLFRKQEATPFCGFLARAGSAYYVRVGGAYACNVRLSHSGVLGGGSDLNPMSVQNESDNHKYHGDKATLMQ
ncbi:hypothetical protein V8B97DRAFT_1915125 [Scleroderma yunnanense]